MSVLFGRFGRKETRFREETKFKIQLVRDYRCGGWNHDGSIHLANGRDHHSQTKKNIQTWNEWISAFGGQRRSIFNIRRDLGFHVS